MKPTQFIILLTITLLVTSCSRMTDTKVERDQAVEKAIKDVIKVPESWAVTVAKNQTKASTRWLESFNDPMMLKLIQEAKANNKDLQVAAGNMDKAWLLARQSGAALKPVADMSLDRSQSGRMNNSTSSKNVSVGLKVSWEADLWGRMRSNVQASEARAQAAKADFIFAQHSLSANVAKTYFKVIETKLQANIARKNLMVLQKSMRIAELKYANGISSAQDVALNRSNLASAQEQLTKIEGSQRDAIRALEVLLGRYPNAKLDIPAVLPNLPPPPPAGVPSEILERRPDIVSAERQVAVAFDMKNQAKAARLPRFSLTNSVSGASKSLSEVLSPSNIAWKLGSNLMVPLFDGNKRKIDVKIATVEQKQAISNYAQKALTAFSEVENNLDQERVLANREKSLHEVQTQSQKAYNIAQLRYKEGESNLLDALQIQEKAISAESNLLSIKRNQLEQRINLYLALGGEW